MRRFEFSDSTSNKFWEVDVDGKTLNVAEGINGWKVGDKIVVKKEQQLSLPRLIKKIVNPFSAPPELHQSFGRQGFQMNMIDFLVTHHQLS